MAVEQDVGCCVVPSLPTEDDLLLGAEEAHWVLREAQGEDVVLLGARFGEDGGWWPCEPADLLGDVAFASIGQRLGCQGVVTAVYLWSVQGLHGAWLANRPGIAEPASWRVVLLRALLLETLGDSLRSSAEVASTG